MPIAMKNRITALFLFAATVILNSGCAGPRDDSLERDVLRLKHPGCLTAGEAALHLRDSLARRRAAAPGPELPVRVETTLRVAPGCAEHEKAVAENLARQLFSVRESLLSAGGLTEKDDASRGITHRFTLELEALPGAGCFVHAELEDNGKMLWREVLPVME